MPKPIKSSLLTLKAIYWLTTQHRNILEQLLTELWAFSSTSVLRSSTVKLVHSATEYASSVWLDSKHTMIVNTQLKWTIRIISGTIRKTPNYWLAILNHIPLPKLRRNHSPLREYRKVQANHQLPIHHDKLNIEMDRLRFRYPPVLNATSLHGERFSLKNALRRH